MELLDIRTIVLSHVITNAICFAVMVLLWLRNRNRFEGLGFWVTDFAIQFTVLLLVVLRGTVPDFLSIVVSNTLAIAGTILLYAGLERFVGKRTAQSHNYLFLAVFIIIHTYFAFVQPSLLIRTINVSVGIIFLCSQCAWLLIYRADADMRPSTREVGYIFLAFCFFSFLRIFLVLVMDPGNDFFQSGLSEALAILINQILFMILTFGLLLMVNRRLILDLERDLIQRKRVEEELRRLSRVVEQSQMSVMITDTSGAIEYVNPKFCEMTGYSLEEVCGQNPRILRAVGASSEVYRELWDTITAGRKWHGEFHNQKKNGELFWESTIISPIMNEQGMITHFVAVKEDITEQKQKDEILRHRTNVLAALHQVVLDLVNRHEMDEILQTLLGNIDVLLDVSDVSIDLVENEDTLVTHAATPDQPLVKGDTMRRGEGGWLSWQAVETGQAAILEDYSTWLQRRELYEGFPIHAIAIIPIHHRDRVIGTINFSRREPNKPFNETDIYVAEQLAEMVALVLDNAQLYVQLQAELAERKRIEENLLESRENFQRYFNVSTVGMCVTAPDRRWIETNGRLRQMLGYSAEELDNLTWSEITHPDDLDADLALFNQLLANERDSYQLDKRYIRKDGAIVYTTSFVSCYRNPNGSVRYCLASLVDITDRTLAKESLLKLAAIEERQRLARDLHDSVNQSIHGLVLFSETLVSTLEKNNMERARHIADRLQESARQALKETRLMLYEMQTTDPERSVDLVKDLEKRLVTVERRAGVKAQILQEGSMDHCPPAWHENLFWITIEALNNALKHAQARNMQIRIRCSSIRVEMEIVDDGIGFDVDKPRVGGLGLQNMRDRASLLGGQLTIHSTPRQGSCVRFIAEIKE
jgi:PAS domain S-box-containing protein